MCLSPFRLSSLFAPVKERQRQSEDEKLKISRAEKMIFSKQSVGRSADSSRFVHRSLSLSVSSSSFFISLSFLFLLAARKSDMFHLQSLSRRSCRARAISRRIDPRYPFFPFGHQPDRAAATFRPASHEKREKKKTKERKILEKPYFYPDALIYDTFDRFCHSAASLWPSSAHICRLT